MVIIANSTNKDDIIDIDNNNKSKMFDEKDETNTYCDSDLVEDTLTDFSQSGIVIADDVERSLAVKYDKPNSSELALIELYQQYEKKLGIKVSYVNFKDYISHIVESNKVQRKIVEAINAKITVDISQRIILKSILTFNTLIDRAYDMILKQTEGENATFSPELVGMIDKCMQWLKQLSDLKGETMSKISDPDKFITDVMNRANKDIVTNKDLHDKDGKLNEEKSMTVIEDIVKQLNNEY